LTRTKSSREPAETLVAALSKKKRPLLVSHVTPDADAIGSSLGLATIMRDAGIDAVCCLPRLTVPKKLEFMLALAPKTPCVGSWSTTDGYDAIIVLDTAGEKRANIRPGLDAAGDIDVFNLDHHVSNTGFGEFVWIDAESSSTSDMIARMAHYDLHWEIAPNVASLLYAGIHADTSGFSLPTTTAGTLSTASMLVELKANVALIGEEMYRSQARSDFELLRFVYDRTVVSDDGLIAHSQLTHEDFVAAGAKAEDIDDQVSIPLALKGVRIALLFTEGVQGVVRINLRGEGDVTVIELAKRFGGGGHAHAAGAIVRDLPMQKVIHDVVAAARAHLDSIASAS
jgi:phosphoesterase RecJ-like protein